MLVQWDERDGGTRSQYIRVYMTEVMRRDILDPHIILITLLARPRAPLSLTSYNILVKIGSEFLKLYLNIELMRRWLFWKLKYKGFSIILWFLTHLLSSSNKTFRTKEFEDFFVFDKKENPVNNNSNKRLLTADWCWHWLADTGWHLQTCSKPRSQLIFGAHTANS